MNTVVGVFAMRMVSKFVVCGVLPQLLGCVPVDGGTIVKSQVEFRDDVSFSFGWPQVHPCMRQTVERRSGVTGAVSTIKRVPSLWIPLELRHLQTDAVRHIYLVWAQWGGISISAQRYVRGVYLSLPEPSSVVFCGGDSKRSEANLKHFGSEVSAALQQRLSELLLPDTLRVWNAPSSRKFRAWGRAHGVNMSLERMESEFPSSWKDVLMEELLEDAHADSSFSGFSDVVRREDAAVDLLSRWNGDMGTIFQWMRHRLGLYSVVRQYIDLRRKQLPHGFDLGSQGPPHLTKGEYVGTWMLAEAQSGYGVRRFMDWEESIGLDASKCHRAVGTPFFGSCKAFSPPFVGKRASRKNADGPVPILTEEFHAFCKGVLPTDELNFGGSGSGPSANEVQSLATAMCNGRALDFFSPSAEKVPEGIRSEVWGLGTKVTPVFGGHGVIQVPVVERCENPGGYREKPEMVRTRIDFYPGAEKPTRHTGMSADTFTVYLDAQYADKPHPGTDAMTSADDHVGDYFVARAQTSDTGVPLCPQRCEDGAADGTADATSHSLLECPRRRERMNDAIEDVVSILGGEAEDGTAQLSEVNVLRLLLSANHYRRR